jgi:hypothetical protein
VRYTTEANKGTPPMPATIDYNKVREMLGTVVTDGSNEYVVSDYKMKCDAYELWCKNRQQFYFTSYNGLHNCFRVISG